MRQQAGVQEAISLWPQENDGGGPRGPASGPKPRRSDEELLSAPRTREFTRSLNMEELIVVHDQGLCGRGRQKSDSPPAQEATETIRLYDTEAENEAVEWLYGEWRENTMITRYSIECHTVLLRHRQFMQGHMR